MSHGHIYWDVSENNLSQFKVNNVDYKKQTHDLSALFYNVWTKQDPEFDSYTNPHLKTLHACV